MQRTSRHGLASGGARRKIVAGVAVVTSGVGLSLVAPLAAQGTPALCTATSSFSLVHQPATGTITKQSNFEVDTSANLRKDGGSNCIDWKTVASSNEPGDKPSGPADDAFGQGTSEDDPVPTVVAGSIPPNKSDLSNFGVYEEAGPLGGHYVALNWARINNPSGTTNMDFELNQKFCDASATTNDCSANNVTPKRTSGDLLITYDLAKGGTHPTISVRTWGGSAWGAATTLDATQAAASVNTDSISLSDANPVLPVAHDPYTFGEAVVDLDSILSTCGTFGSVYLKSRSSTSFTSEVKDFVAPQKVHVSNCAGISTSATATATVGSNITDTATLTGLGAGATGTVTFDAYLACNSDGTGSGTSQFNSVISSLGTQDATTGNYSITSGNFAAPVGTYYWVASYSGDGSNTGATGKCTDTGESSTVSPATPGITTTAHNSTYPAEIYDTATLSGGDSPTGTVTYRAYTSSTCSNTASYVSTVPITNGLVPDSNSTSALTGTGGTFAPGAGTYYWQATYNGDTNNNIKVGDCGSANGASETSTVSPRTTTITTTAAGSGAVGSSNPPVIYGSAVSDTATLSGASSDATGSVTFVLYSSCNTTTHAASGLVWTDPTSHSLGTFDTTNHTYTIHSGSFTGTPPLSVGSYYWVASYVSGDNNNSSSTGHCDDANETSVIAPATSTLTTTQSFYPNDSATITGATSGSVTFKLYSGATCTDGANGTLLHTFGPVTVAGGTASTGNTSYAVSATGTYSWQVTFNSTDSNHDSVTGTCGRENSALTVTNGTFETG